MRYKTITDFIDYFENEESQFFETVTETVDLGAKIEDDPFECIQYDRILRYSTSTHSYTDLKYDFDKCDRRVFFEATGTLCFVPNDDHSPCMCTVSYKTKSKELVKFCSAISACYSQKKTESYCGERVEICDSTRLTDAGHSLLVKILKYAAENKIDIANLNLTLDEIKDFLLIFNKSTIDKQIEICETGIFVPLLKRLKELDINEPDCQRTTHFIHFRCGSCWCLPIDVIIERKLDRRILAHQLWEDRHTGCRKYESLGVWSQEFFEEFLKELEALDIENWERVVCNTDVRDGASWEYLQYGEEMTAFARGGYSAFPKRFHELEHLFEKISKPTDLYDMRRYKRACKYYENTTGNCTLTNRHCEGASGCENFMWLKGIGF